MTPCTTSETMFLFHKKANLWLVGCMVTFYNLAAPSTRRGRRRHLKDWRAGRPISPGPSSLKGRGEKGRQRTGLTIGAHRAGVWRAARRQSVRRSLYPTFALGDGGKCSLIRAATGLLPLPVKGRGTGG